MQPVAGTGKTLIGSSVVTKGETMKYIVHIYWSKSCPIFWVSDLKGKKGDWGYTTDSNKALPLTDSQLKRFNADCRAIGRTFTAIPA